MGRSKNLKRTSTGDDSQLQKALDKMWQVIDENPEELSMDDLIIEYGIPKTTLYRYKKNGDRKVKNKGRRTIIPMEYESILADRIKDSAPGCKGWSPQMVIDAIRRIYQVYSDLENIKDPLPEFSEGWLRCFCKRWGITLKSPIELSKMRAVAVDSTSIMCYLNELSYFVKKFNIPSNNIWTCDETTSIPKGRVNNKVLTARGKDVFIFKSTIAVPKFSMLCSISASGDSIPPFFTIPCNNAKRRDECIPVIGPAELLPTSEAKYTSKGAMTIEKFTYWLKKIFSVKIREFTDNDNWILLIMDNCSCHFDFNCFHWLHTQKIAVAFFPANCTHVVSPLDVLLYSPFKRRLQKALKDFSSLTFLNLASWIAPAYNSTFTKINNKKSFIATGIWDDDIQGPNINWKSSQYKELMTDVPTNIKKMNQSRRQKKLLDLSNQKIDSLLDDERKKIGEKNKKIGGKKFIKTIVAGKTLDSVNLIKVQEIAKNVAEEDRKFKEDMKEKKKNEKETLKAKEQVRIDKITNSYKTKVKELQDKLKFEKKSRSNLLKIRKQKENLESKHSLTVKRYNDFIDILLTTIELSDDNAESIINDMEVKGIPFSLLGKRKQFDRVKRQRKRRK